MKKFICFLLVIFTAFAATACGENKTTNAIELMGAGDRIHDSYTFANTGVKLSSDGENVYTISGSVEKIDNEKVKKEFKIDDDVTHVVAIKLTAIDCEVKKDEVEIMVDGSRAYDEEHLNGTNYTFIILDAIASRTATIKVKWSKDADEKSYVIKFADDIVLK